MRTSRIAVPIVVLLALGTILAAAWHAPHSGYEAAIPTTAPSAATGSQVTGATGPLLIAAGLATTSADGAVHVDALAVGAELAKIPVGSSSSGGYRRDAFGPAWADADHNGCDTRNDILRRDLTGVQLKPGTHDCVVLAGTLADPYTGTTIAFARGERTSTLVQIDHIVPEGWSWQHGAAGWTPAQREQFSNDPAELQAVDGSANESKSDGGPSAWLPPAAANHCAYVARFTYIVAKYSMTISAADRDAVSQVLATCR